MTDEEVRRVLDSIDALGSTGDAEERARRLTELLDQWPSTHAKVREMRQQAIAELYDSGNGLTYKEIGDMLGISFGRVRQIIAGETVSPKRRKPTRKPEDNA
ncbi:sigma factor-like helix-turn-helix DNA-binding protein [Streptomyces macrosporus]|uniref:sigma factor-like helix-turn-helix DNA-binding protein n=1 Tax=Streptomyces macrosporus TaxID=44032 RepID=UPI0031D3680D